MLNLTLKILPHRPWRATGLSRAKPRAWCPGVIFAISRPRINLLVHFLRFGVPPWTYSGGGDAGLGLFRRSRDLRRARFLARASLGWCGVGRSATRF